MARENDRIRSALIAGFALLASMLVVAGTAPPTASAALSPDPSAAIASGDNHQCVALADQTVRCWGGNHRGQLGDGTTTDSLAPVAVHGLSDVVALDAGSDFTCALTAAGTVGCWGRNTSGSLGDPGAGSYETTPTFGNGLTGAVQISVGATHACALLDTGSVMCWGDNDDEQLGDGTNTDATSPVAALGLDDATQISAGFGSTCAVRADSTLSCWGYNGTGLFGNGTNTGSAAPVDIVEAGAVRQVAVGFRTACVITDTGHARCAGAGPLGDDTGDDSRDFVDVGLPPVLDISVGGEICAIAPDASVWCWGPDYRFIGGDASGAGQAPSSEEPRLIEGVESVTAIAAGTNHTCAANIDGDLWCWGVNVGGELQIESTIIEEPGTIVPGVEAKQLSAGHMSCAITLDDTVSCWGIDLRPGNGGLPSTTPVPPTEVDGVTGAVDVSAAFLHACAALTDGTVTCWGYNVAGEVGFPAPPDPYSPDALVAHPPTPVDGFNDATEVSAGNAHSCSAGGAIARCWGADTSGQLGDGTTVGDSSPVEVLMPPMTTSVDLVDSGHTFSCARVAVQFFGVVAACWGSNASGQLGDSTTTDRTAPVGTGIVTPKSIATGGTHACAIDSADDVYCWGANDSGQVGTGGQSVSVPAASQVTGFTSTPVEVAAGNEHSCALLADGSVACWGSNAYHQTGQTVYGDVLTPTTVPGISGVTHLAAGFDSTCALLSDSSVTCWGSNQWGTTGRNPIVEQPRRMDVGEVSVPAELTTAPIFHPVTPARLLETRPGLATVDGASQGDGAVRAGTSLEFQVAGRADVPADARFAVVNVTAVRPSSSGYFTVHGCQFPRPNVASLNFTNRSGDGPVNLGNETIVELSSTGSICVFTSATTDITVDVSAYGTSRGAYTPAGPERILDSRPGESTTDGQYELGAPVAGGTQIELQVTGRAGIDDTAEAAVLYIAAVNPSAVGFVTAHPCLPEPPTASSLNMAITPGVGGISRGNEVLAPLSDDGVVCLYVSATTDLTVDLMGATDIATTFEPIAPARLLETRPGQAAVDGIGQRGSPLAGGTQIELQVAGRAGIDDNASLAALNITAVRPTGTGFVTAHPCEPRLPTASSLNFAAPAATGPINGGNEVLVPISDDGTVCLYVSTTTHLTVDAVGFS